MSRKSTCLNFFCAILIISGYASFILSCKGNGKEDLYIGNWQNIDTVSENDIVYVTTRTMQLGRTTYEEIYEIQHQSGGSITAIVGTRGYLVASRENVTFELRELGTCARDMDFRCTSTIQWFGEGTQYWNNNIQFFSRSVKGDLKADETTLTLVRDLNNDGDTLDAGEQVVFTRI